VPLILGINAFHGDASAVAFLDGDLLSAVEEERFNRVKHWAGFPVEAIRHCAAGMLPDHVAVSRDPYAHLGRKILRVLLSPALWSNGARRAGNVARISRLRSLLEADGVIAPRTKLHFVEHHRAHLASAFFCSPFEDSAVLSIDAFGDFSSLMWGAGAGNRIDVKGSVRFPHSLGMFYSAFTQFLGFPGFGDEQKLMSLAAFGEPRYASELRDVVKVEGGQVRLDLDYFEHAGAGVVETWNDCAPSVSRLYTRRMVERFGPPRDPGAEALPRHNDLAASVQAVLEEAYLSLLNYVARRTGARRVCLAGGVALNCVANGMILDRTPFREVFVQPAANDAGTSLGAALFVQHQVLNRPRSFVMRHAAYGDEFTDRQVCQALSEAGLAGAALPPPELIRRTAGLLADGKIVGWFQGRMEFGPRALGNRSILADPRRPEMRDVLNRRIKHRESFRPFCPSVLDEDAAECFESSHPSPFMTMACKVRPSWRERIPAVVHCDGTARLQTVTRDAAPRYWALLREFRERTGVGVLLNTSFNDNEPIVRTPAEAIACFLETRMDALAIGSYVLENPSY
jgi:carbamoyltransferase